MATPSFRSVGTWAFTVNNVVNPTNLSPGAPANKAAGDLLVLVAESRSITATVSTPTGWNLVSGFPKRSGTASGGTIYVWTRIADGGANDAPTVTWSGLTTGTSGDASGAGILCYQGGLTEVLDNTVQSSDLSAQTNTSVIPAFTVVVNNTMVIGIALKLLESSNQTSTVATFTERSDNQTTTGTGHIIAVSEIYRTSAGSSGSATVTWSATGSARAFTVSLGLRAPIDLVVADATSATSADNVVLTQANTLVVADAASATSADAIALAQANTLAVQDATVATSADSPTLEASGGSIELAVDDVSVATSAESLALVQANTLAVADAIVGTSAENVAVVQANVLAVADSSVATSAENIALTQANLLAVADATSATTSESPALVQANTLAVADATVATSAETPALVQQSTLAVSDSQVATSAETPALTQANILAVADATAATAAENVDLASGLALEVQDVFVATGADTPGLIQAHTLAVADVSIATSADVVELASGLTLEVQDAAVATSAESPTLMQANVLTVADAVVAVTVESPTLTIPGDVTATPTFLAIPRSTEWIRATSQSVSVLTVEPAPIIVVPRSGPCTIASAQSGKSGTRLITLIT